MIYVVLGMHKSGTTLVSRTLHNSGIVMGEHFEETVSYDSGNKYERESTLALNMEILGVDTYRIYDMNAPEKLCMDARQERRMLEIIETCNSLHRDWGFKDPRTTLTYPLWRDRLPEHRLVVIYRAPEQLWPRFRQGGIRRQYLNPVRAWQYLSRWCEHNERILGYIRTSKYPYLVLNYSEFMQGQQEFERLAAFVGRDLADPRNPGLYRGKRAHYPLVKAAAWLLEKFTGKSTRKILQQLDVLRAQQCQGAPAGAKAEFSVAVHDA